jgi:hypothetical protein
MAEFIFDCPSCQQAVQADDAWAGQEIQCPLCHAPMIVPQAHAPTSPGHDVKSLGQQLVEVPKETKLKAGPTQTPRSTTGTGAPTAGFKKPVARKQNPVLKYAGIGGVVVLLVVAGIVAWPYVKPHLSFLKSKEESAAALAAATPAAPAEPTPPPPPKEVPMTPPTYTLEVAQAKISDGKANGSIAGTNFVADLVRLDKIGAYHVLDLRQGAGATPDRGLRVYLQLPAAGSPTGQVYSIAKEMKGPPVNRIVRVWKTNPKYAAQEKPFYTGFALKLEFGALTESNTVSGKIYVALPDAEKTVIGGTFNAITSLGGVPGGIAQPQAATVPQAEAMSPDFRRRYGAPAGR